MKFRPFLCAILWACVLPGFALAGDQHATFIDLSATPQWQVENSQQLGVDAVSRWNGNPAVDREYGVASVDLRTYRHDGETAQAVVEQAPDASAAFGLFTFYRNPSMHAEKGIAMSAAGSGEVLLARGKDFVRVLRPNGMSDQDFQSLLRDISGTKAPSESRVIPAPLPANGQVPGSMKYLLGPVAAKAEVPFLPASLIGFQKGAELETAAYGNEPKQQRLILISYPTPQIAKAHYQSMTQALGINGRQSDAIYGKRKDTYVLLVQGAASQKQAEALMNGLSFHRVVSWDQPPPDKPVARQLFTLIVGNLLLVLILAGLAIGTGFLIFGSRRLAAKWFPHSDWARGYEDSIIRLNLKGQ